MVIFYLCKCNFNKVFNWFLDKYFRYKLVMEKIRKESFKEGVSRC